MRYIVFFFSNKTPLLTLLPLPHKIKTHEELRFEYDSHDSDVIMGTMASQITILTIVYSTVYSGACQRKHKSSAPQASVRGIHRWPVNSPQKRPTEFLIAHFTAQSYLHLTIMLNDLNTIVKLYLVSPGNFEPAWGWKIRYTKIVFICLYH